MAAAIRSDDPVIFIEHKDLLLRKASSFRHATPFQADDRPTRIGQAVVARAGRDLTVATISASVEYAIEAADILAQNGHDIEVIDLRSVVPLDATTVARSVARTGRLLVVDEDYLSFGLSAELIVRVFDQIGTSVVKRFVRHAVPDVPIPAALTLEQAIVPNVRSIAEAMREALS